MPIFKNNIGSVGKAYQANGSMIIKDGQSETVEINNDAPSISSSYRSIFENNFGSVEESYQSNGNMTITKISTSTIAPSVPVSNNFAHKANDTHSSQKPKEMVFTSIPDNANLEYNCKVIVTGDIGKNVHLHVKEGNGLIILGKLIGANSDISAKNIMASSAHVEGACKILAEEVALVKSHDNSAKVHGKNMTIVEGKVVNSQSEMEDQASEDINNNAASFHAKLCM